jgi:hypothetical protein
MLSLTFLPDSDPSWPLDLASRTLLSAALEDNSVAALLESRLVTREFALLMLIFLTDVNRMFALSPHESRA